ncbi:CubicO group peptidase (beta-lactamase class C family) [Neolewinella xylanilytica]|uniref:CubicO group peptidase (Beta-lactamase class C family) n=1 Tax=Neolewinella xylanilytica TaxID=1514080 RepID=A0A2S6I0A5_9BACT|nr:serine hydrolase domain-containing protein [Neolewinella xylanilytica]PPK84114.1 CubicO group peptidase (beta-lactamase class C family) [Neolewinella xylanilytica]
MRQFLVTICVCLFITLPVLSQSLTEAGLTADGIQRLEAWLEGEVTERRLPMAEILLYRNGVVGYHHTTGLSDLSSETPLRENQLYHLMSMTKPIVTVAFMMLYEEGHFQLQDKVSTYLPDFADLKVARNATDGLQVATDPATSDVTIQQVLSHTAGFSHGLQGTKLDNEIAAALYYRPHADIASRVNTLATLPLLAQPGEQWIYSTSPDILARLIEVFSGQTVIEFLEDRLFTPLGMDDTGYNIPTESADRLVANHQMADGDLTKAAMQLPSSGNKVFGGSFGLYSTAADYLTFCRMLLNKGELDGTRYLSPKTVELMTMNHVGELRGNGEGFGLGFGIITDVSENGVLGSEGQYFWNGAYSTFFFIDPAENMIAILMSQRSPYSGYHEKMFRQMTYQALGESARK